MINKASEYVKDEEHTTYRFRGNVRYSMVQEVKGWMKLQGARYSDGRSRSGYNLTIENSLDVERRWYKHVNIHVSSGCNASNATIIEVMITVYDCPVSDEDYAEMLTDERVQK